MTSVILQVRHPDLDPGATYRSVLLHDSPSDLLHDAQILQDHVQKLIDAYLCERPIDLVIIPLEPEHPKLTTIDRKVGGEWSHNAPEWYEVRLLWGNTDLDQAVRVLTHEVGHHLRGPRETEVGERYQITESLLHEGIAERLVLEHHGLVGLHHNVPCHSVVHRYLLEWLKREREDIPFDRTKRHDDQEADLVEGFLKGGEMYPPATQLMLMSGLGVRELMEISLPDYLDLILPYVKDLK